MSERIQVALLMWIFRRWFRQSSVHKRNVRRVYGLVRFALVREFYEDSPASLEAFSDECYKSAWCEEKQQEANKDN